MSETTGGASGVEAIEEYPTRTLSRAHSPDWGVRPTSLPFAQSATGDTMRLRSADAWPNISSVISTNAIPAGAGKR